MQKGEQRRRHINEQPEKHILYNNGNDVVFIPTYAQIKPEINGTAAVKLAEYIKDNRY
jgi:hypothetical protein